MLQGRIELPRVLPQWILNPPRLPIPPPEHCLAGVLGIEPRFSGSEPDALPLYYTPNLVPGARLELARSFDH